MIPGRILVVDDKRGEVDELVDEFLRRGEHAIYSGISVESEYCTNVRLLILDYLLLEDSEENSLNAIASIVRDVSERSKFFMIVVWSAKVTPDNREVYRENIMRRYADFYKEDMPGILLEPISKNELDYLSLIKKVETEIGNHPNLNLIYEMERIIDGSKDKVANQIYDIGNWSNLIRNLKTEYDIDSIKRQILFIYICMMRRNVTATKELDDCITRIIGLEEAFNIDDFGQVYASLYYYPISDKEQIGTGDVLCSKKEGKYYMVITPECDITTNKHTATKLIGSIRADHSRLEDTNHVKEIGQLLDIRDEDGSVNPRQVINAIMSGRGLRGNYYNLLFLRDYTKNEFYHLIFDFHKVKSLKKARRVSQLRNYRRVCRVDSPLINDFIQRYASHCSRFGKMRVPKEISRILRSNMA